MLFSLLTSERRSPLSDVVNLHYNSACICLSGLLYSSLVQISDGIVDLDDGCSFNRVTAQREAEIIRCPQEHVLDRGCCLLVYLIQAEVQMLELWTLEHEPVGHFVAIGISAKLALNRVEYGHWLLRLFLLSELLVLLNDRISLLNLGLVGFHLICREGYLPEATKNWKNIRCG